MKEHLKSLIHEYRERKITYDVPIGWTVPVPDSYVVAIKRKDNKPGSVYQIVSCREVASKVVGPDQIRYALSVISVPEMRAHVQYDPESNEAFVKHMWAYPLWWNSRDKKQPSL